MNLPLLVTSLAPHLIQCPRNGHNQFPGVEQMPHGGPTILGAADKMPVEEGVADNDVEVDVTIGSSIGLEYHLDNLYDFLNIFDDEWD